ncbi:MAG: chorismate synthase [Clostridia bacterium]|nr:chorismate synthase [Clostridia bacterium]
MSSAFGTKLKISIFGQSHADVIGVVIDGFPAGFPIDFEALQAFLARRAPGNAAFSTKRKEADIPKFLTGVVDGVTCGAPICAVIENTNLRSGDYSNLFDSPRPSHADYPAQIKFNGFQDVRGGGHFSGRLTAALCIAGGLCLQYLKTQGISVGAHISSIGQFDDNHYAEMELDPDIFLKDTFPVYNQEAKQKMLSAIEEARKDGDSVGGTIECAVLGLQAGIGDPMFDGIENKLSAAVFGIPAIKGIEFGSGFAGTRLYGSQNNDPYYYVDQKVQTKTNNHGGILGGISTGMPILFRVAVKPTPSIAKEQLSVNLKTGENGKLLIKGRHDPCIVPRAVPCVEAACAIALCDYLF